MEAECPGTAEFLLHSKAPSPTVMNLEMETSSKGTHLNGAGTIASSLNRGAGRVTASSVWFLFCVLVISTLHLDKGARSVSPSVLSSCTRQRRPGGGGGPPLEAAAVCRKPLSPHDEVLRWAGLGPPRDAPILVPGVLLGPRSTPRTQEYITFGGKGTLQASFRC